MNLKAKRNKRIRRLCGTAKTIVRNRVYVKYPDIQSRASYIELITEYQAETKDYWWRWLMFRDEWVWEQYKRYGTLTCCHCGRKNLKFCGNGRDVATVDHIIPVSLGGPKYDTTNFQLMCAKCNSRRGNMSMEKFTKSYPRRLYGRNER